MHFKTFVKRYFPALLVFITLVIFSSCAYYVAASSVKARRIKLFHSGVQRVIETVNNRMIDYIQILKGCQGLYYASDSVTAKDWKTYFTSLNVSANYPGIQAIAAIKYIHRSKAAELEAQMRNNVDASYSIKSDFKAEYLAPFIFIEPINKRNLYATGYDLWSESGRREGMVRAMVTGEPTITKRLILLHETNDNLRPGFIMFLPIYSNPKSIKTPADRTRQIKGFVSNIFRASDLMGGLLKRFSELDVEIFDGRELGSKNLLYSNIGNKTTSSFNAKLNVDTSIFVAGSPWRFRIRPNENFGSALEQQQPLLILICGLAISVLFSVLIAFIVTRNTQVTDELTKRKVLEEKKDEFIGIASHELKTPLTSIKASIQLLERSNLSDRDRLFVEKANVNIKKLNNLIGDLLDVSKIQAGRLELNTSKFTLSDLIEDSIENVQHIYTSHEIIRPGNIPHLVLVGDKFRLEQAINNLLLNAIKYSPLRSQILINTRVSAKYVRVEIIDHGIGISEENQEKIFQRFFRAQELSPVISGLGVGLYLSQEIVKRHNGQIGVQSELGKGSTFYIDLPI